MSTDEFDDLPGIGPPEHPDDFVTAAEAVLEYLKQKSVVTPEDFVALEDDAKQRAFTVAGLTDLDLMQDVWEAIDSAVRNGESLEGFRDRVEQKLEDGWGGEDPSQLDTIFRTNVQTAYAVGRQEQNGRVRETHPYIAYSVIDDDRTSDICRPLIGVVVRADSAYAADHHPPLHFNCRTDEVAITEEEARERGIDDEPPDVDADDGFGDPSADFEPDLSTRAPELANIYQAKLQAGEE